MRNEESQFETKEWYKDWAECMSDTVEYYIILHEKEVISRVVLIMAFVAAGTYFFLALRNEVSVPVVSISIFIIYASLLLIVSLIAKDLYYSYKLREIIKNHKVLGKYM